MADQLTTRARNSSTWRVRRTSVRLPIEQLDPHSPADPDQLYDLVEDPDEIQNLSAAAAQGARLREFRAEVERRWDLPALHAAVLASQARRRLVNRALRAGRYTPWDFQPMRDASRQYVRNDQDLGDLEAIARFPRFSPTMRA